MRILVCNVGSTSLKYQLFDMDAGEAVIASGGAERVGSEKSEFYVRENGKKTAYLCRMPTHREAIQEMLCCLLEHPVDCVGFKVVHAKGVTGTQLLTDRVLSAMEDFNSVAPAHNPPYLAAIRLFRELMPGIPLIGAFETAFHANMPPEAKLYSIPTEISERYAIRRYGFHGASHEYMTHFAAEKLGTDRFRLISCHLGGSGSLCAVRDGLSVDTSMGLSLQCGVMQNNRIADIDPYIIFYLAEECGLTLPEIKTVLQTKSGLLGMSGVSNDLRDVQEAAEQGNERAAIAVRTYCYLIRKYIGSYLAVLGGADAITFGGGIGRNSAFVREQTLSGLEFAGICLDREKNAAACGGSDISADGSPVRVFVVDTNEEIVVARKAAALLKELEGK